MLKEHSVSGKNLITHVKEREITENCTQPVADLGFPRRGSNPKGGANL